MPHCNQKGCKNEGHFFVTPTRDHTAKGCGWRCMKHLPKSKGFRKRHSVDAYPTRELEREFDLRRDELLN